jgi:DNA-binding Lrp family transcriptional regulator
MDATDTQILALLRENARRSYGDIGEQVALSPPAVKRRVDRLRETGALVGFTTVVDEAAMGASTEALVELFFAPGRCSTRSPRR